MSRSQVILDMDPGIDDALALVLGLNRLDVLGVCAVAGNVGLDKTFRNARHILQVAGREDIPVLAGAEAPLFNPLLPAEHVHGTSGLGNYVESIEPVPIPPGETAWNWMARQQTDEASCHLIATGPLTDLALLFLAYPGSGKKWASVTCMCGALPGTQVDRFEEFNVFLDPHAADIVFRDAQRVQLVGINVAHKALFPINQIDRFKEYGRVGRMLHDMLSFYATKARGEGGDPNAFPIDDVLTIAAVDFPELFEWVELPLTVVREGPLRGTVVVSQIPRNRPPVRVASSVNVSGFLDWLWSSMG